MTQQRRRLLVVVHVLTSVSGIGTTLAVILVLALDLSTPDTEGQGAFFGLADDIQHLIGIPLLSTAVLIGILSALYSPWGLFKHTWVLKKLVLTLANLALAVFVIGPGVTGTADLATAWLVFGALVAQLVLYLLATGLSVFKPKGLVARSDRAGVVPGGVKAVDRGQRGRTAGVPVRGGMADADDGP